jgi:hypothetical protein
MPEISLVVTQRVFDRTVPDHRDEAQLAIRSASEDIAPSIRQLNAKNRANLRLGGFITLVVGDTAAIWRSHNKHQVEDFDALFNLLARRPDQEMRFLCDLVR